MNYDNYKLLWSVGLVLSFVDVILSQIDPSQAQDCISGPSSWYQGTHNVTKDGIPCQRWDVDHPHPVRTKPKGDIGHNYCRNPDNDLRGLWCYTTDKDVKWQSCGIRKCSDNSLMLYTHQNANGDSYISHYPADPELKTQQPDMQRTIYDASGSFVWAIAADKKKKRVFFTDYRLNYLGVLSLATNETTFHMHGMCHGVEELAYDWVAENLYWTDTDKKWVMVSDLKFEHFVKIYKNESEDPFGLTLHAGKRRLYFALYNKFTSSLKMSDMAGNNVTTLFQSSIVADVPSLTVDYTDDRIYWINNLSPRTYVASCDLDGKNLTIIYRRPLGRYWGIATYMNTIYLADQIGYQDPTNGRYYRMWILNKQGEARDSYKLPTKIKSMAIYSTNEEYLVPSIASEVAESNKACLHNHPCDQLCIPLSDGKYSCQCSLGYVKIGDTKCRLNYNDDNFLLMVDLAQKKIFQIPFDDNVQNYTALQIPATFDDSVTTNALDSARKIVYWSNRKTTTIYKSKFDGTNSGAFLPHTHANAMAVDPSTGNIYYADDDSGYLYVVDKSGAYPKVLYKPSDSSFARNHIEDLSLDLQNKHIYWTAVDITADEDDINTQGVVMRMGLDGSSSSIVFHNILTPRALHVDNKKNRLFLASNGDTIYEIPLSMLKTPNGNIPSTRTRHNVRSVSRSNPIIDFLVRGDFGYIIGKTSKGIIKFNLKNSNYQRDFGSSDFFQPRFLALFDSTYQKQYSSPLQECATLQCSQLCLQRPEGGATCYCGNGYKKSSSSSNTCVKTTLDNEPPSYGGSCPKNIELQYLHCKPAIPLPPWDPPAWTDDNTPAAKLKKTSPTIQDTYKAGTYTFIYTATDESGNVGQCLFTVTITRALCRLVVPERSLNLSISSPKCVNGDIVHTVRCRNRKQWIRYGNWFNKTTYNLCLPSLEWMISNYTQLSCEYPQSSASSNETTVASHVTVSTTPGTTTTQHPSSTKRTPPTRPQKTTTSPPNKPPTTTTTTTNTKKAPVTTTKKAKITSVKPKETTTTAMTSVKGAGNSTSSGNGTYGENAQKHVENRHPVPSSGISGGVVAAIVVVIIVLVAVAAGIYVKKKRMWPTGTLTNPISMMWNRSNDQGLTHSPNEDYHKF